LTDQRGEASVDLPKVSSALKIAALALAATVQQPRARSSSKNPLLFRRMVTLAI